MADRVEIDLIVNDPSLKQAGQDVEKFGNQTKTAGNEAEAAGKKAGMFGGALGDISKMAAGFLGANLLQAGFIKITGAITGAFEAAIEHQKIQAQTEAVLKSTGEAAGVTAHAVESLAKELSSVTTYSAGTVQSTENLLLTFTKIGKEIFPEATEAILNMSTALGQDTKSSAIQLGKALNDPILGLTALKRVGVAFTEDQKTMIKGMVEAGDVMGAQKIILAELATEFGGSAKAAGETFGGQLTILQNQLKGTFRTMAEEAMPALTALVRGFVELSMTVKGVVLGAFEALKTILGPVFQLMADNSGTVKLVAGMVALGLAAGPVVSGIAAIGLALKALIVGTTETVAAINPILLAIVAVAAATDVLLRKTTDEGLVGWGKRIFGDASAIDASKKAMQEMAGVTPTVDDAMRRLTSTVKDFAAENVGAKAAQSGFANAMLGSDDRLFGFNIGLSDGIDKLKEYKAQTKELGKEMVAAKAGPLELWEAYKLLPPELQKTFDATTNMSAQLSSEKFIMGEAAKETDSWVTRLGFAYDAHGKLHDATSTSVTKTQRFIDAMDDAEEAAAKEGKAFTGVTDALKGLIQSYVDFDPEVMAAKSSMAMLTLEYDKIIVKGDAATASEKARAETINKELIPALQGTIKVHEDLNPIITNTISEIGTLIGDGGKGLTAMAEALQAQKMPGEELARVLDSIRKNMEDQDAGHAVAEFKKLFDSVDVANRPELATAFGPILIERIRAGVADPAEQEKLLSAVREMMGVKVPAAVSSGEPSSFTAGAGVGFQIMAGTQSGIEQASAGLIATAAQKIRDVVSAMQNAANIFSPSKDTRDKVGIPLIEGIGVGMNQAAPQVGLNATNFMLNLISSLKAQAKAGVNEIQTVLSSGNSGYANVNGGASIGTAVSKPNVMTPKYTVMGGGIIKAPGPDLGTYSAFGNLYPYVDTGGGMKTPKAKDGTLLWNATTPIGDKGGGITINGGVTINTTDPDAGKAAIDDTMYKLRAAAMAKGLA